MRRYAEKEVADRREIHLENVLLLWIIVLIYSAETQNFFPIEGRHSIAVALNTRKSKKKEKKKSVEIAIKND